MSSLNSLTRPIPRTVRYTRVLVPRERRQPVGSPIVPEVPVSPSEAWLWDWVPQSECARWLGIRPSTLSEWTSAGQVPYGRVGRVPRYQRGALVALINAGTFPAEPGTFAPGEAA